MLETNVRKRPRRLWNAIIALYLQAFLNAFAGVLLVSLSDDDAPETAVLGYGSIVLAVVLLASAVLLTRGVGWVRWPVVVIEVLGIISGLIGLFSGMVTAIGGLVLSVLVLVNLFHSEVRLWFDPVSATPQAPLAGTPLAPVAVTKRAPAPSGDWVEDRIARVRSTSQSAGDPPLTDADHEVVNRLVQLGHDALGSAEAEVRAIGGQLHRSGGVPLMRSVLHEAEVVSLRRHSRSIMRGIEQSWNGIGSWMG